MKYKIVDRWNDGEEKLLVKSDSGNVEVVFKDGNYLIWGVGLDGHLQKAQAFRDVQKAQKAIVDLAKSGGISDLEKSYRREYEKSIIRAQRHETAADILKEMGC